MDHSHDFNANRPRSLDERLTDYLLGELPEGERAVLDAALDSDAVLRERLHALAATVILLRGTPDTPALAGERRAALRDAAAAVTPVPAGKVLRFPWRTAAGLGAAAALLVTVALLRERREAPPPGDTTVRATDAAELKREIRQKETPVAVLDELGYVATPDGSVPPTAAGEELRAAFDKLGYAAPQAGATVLQLEVPSADRFAGLVAPESAPIDPTVQLGTGLYAFGGSAESLRGERVRVVAPNQRFSAVEARPSEAPPAPSSPPPARPVPGDGPGRRKLESREARLGFDVGDAFGKEPIVGGDHGGRGGIALHDGYGHGYSGVEVIEHLRPRHARETPRDMFFRFYGDNPFVNADSDRFSTFAADVDSASYPLARNYLVNGSIPPRAAVRTEEFVNYFRSELAPPAEGDFAISLEHAPSPFGNSSPGLSLLKVGIKAREVDRKERKPVRLTFVIDSSGSMAEGNRLELVKRTLGLLVDQMRDDDQIGIVTFNSEGREVLEPTAGEDRHKIRAAIGGLQSGGSTNAQSGLQLGYRMAERQFRDGAVNRVVLCSDGVANTGQTDQEKILEEVARAAEHAIDITSVGVGMNNHNDVFLEQIADKGNGSCHYVDDDQEARRVFVDGFVGTLQVVARDVKIQVEFNPQVVRSWRQLGYENRAVADQDFRNDSVDAGEIGAGHEVVALYEVEPALQLWDGPAPVFATVRLRWRPDGGREFVEIEQSLEGVPGIGRFGTQAPRFRLSAVAAQYAEVLRRSYWAQGDSYGQLLEEAERLARELPGDAAVAELRDMIRRTRALCEAWPPRDELASLIEEGRRTRLQEADLMCRDSRTPEMEELLSQVRRQNDEIERRLRELLDR